MFRTLPTNVTIMSITISVFLLAAGKTASNRFCYTKRVEERIISYYFN